MSETVLSNGNDADRVAIVTGSTQGLGRGIAIALMERGVSVMVCGPEVPDNWSAGLPMDKARAAAFPCDIRDSSAVAALWAAAERELGPVDICVNNAGLALTGSRLVDLPEADFRSMVEINLLGTMNVCRVGIARAISQGADGGRRLTIGNVLGAGWDGVPVPSMNGYASSKAGVTFLSKALAAEHADDPVTIAAISPGIVMTEGFLREHAKVPAEVREARERVVNIIGDHVEVIANWVADLMLGQAVHGENHVWLTAEKIAARQAEVPPRDVLSRYLVQDR